MEMSSNGGSWNLELGFVTFESWVGPGRPRFPGVLSINSRQVRQNHILCSLLLHSKEAIPDVSQNNEPSSSNVTSVQVTDMSSVSFFLTCFSSYLSSSLLSLPLSSFFPFFLAFFSPANLSSVVGAQAGLLTHLHSYYVL